MTSSQSRFWLASLAAAAAVVTLGLSGYWRYDPPMVRQQKPIPPAEAEAFSVERLEAVAPFVERQSAIDAGLTDPVRSALPGLLCEVVDESDVAVSRAWLLADGLTGRRLETSAAIAGPSGDDGRIFARQRAGELSTPCRIMAKGYLPSEPINLTGRGPARVVLKRGNRLRITCTDTAGLPIGGVLLDVAQLPSGTYHEARPSGPVEELPGLDSRWSLHRGSTAHDGAVELAGLADGAYSIDCHSPHLIVKGMRSVTVASGEERQIELVVAHLFAYAVRFSEGNFISWSFSERHGSSLSGSVIGQRKAFREGYMERNPGAALFLASAQNSSRELTFEAMSSDGQWHEFRRTAVPVEQLGAPEQIVLPAAAASPDWPTFQFHVAGPDGDPKGAIEFLDLILVPAGLEDPELDLNFPGLSLAPGTPTRVPPGKYLLVFHGTVHHYLDDLPRTVTVSGRQGSQNRLELKLSTMVYPCDVSVSAPDGSLVRDVLLEVWTEADSKPVRIPIGPSGKQRAYLPAGVYQARLEGRGGKGPRMKLEGAIHVQDGGDCRCELRAI